jgi:hypothetical protein
MIEKGRTPNGMSETGYIQALENFVYFANKLAKDIEAVPGDPFEKITSLMSRGEVFEQFKETIETLDSTVPVIAETYGYTEKQVEEHIKERFGAHLGDFLLESILEDLQK